MKELTIHGCSFSENLKNNFYPGIEDKLSNAGNNVKNVFAIFISVIFF